MQRTIAMTALLLGFSAAAAAPPAVAQTSASYYFPAKLLKQGKATSPNAGAGTVVVQVAVNPDGTFKVQNVIRSTNPGNNKAALEIAQTSAYKPAHRGDKAIFAYYDFTLKFTKSSVSSVEEDIGGPTSGSLSTYTGMIRDGKYSEAKTGLDSYVAAHPSDTEGQGLLGVANTYLKDYPSAVKAFDLAGTLSPKVAPMAARSVPAVRRIAVDRQERRRRRGQEGRPVHPQRGDVQRSRERAAEQRRLRGRRHQLREGPFTRASRPEVHAAQPRHSRSQSRRTRTLPPAT